MSRARPSQLRWVCVATSLVALAAWAFCLFGTLNLTTGRIELELRSGILDIRLRPWTGADVERLRVVGGYTSRIDFAVGPAAFDGLDGSHAFPNWRALLPRMPSYSSTDLLDQSGIVFNAPSSSASPPNSLNQYMLELPLWLIAVPATSLTVVAFARSRAARNPAPCPRCGYNLTANTSGKCPECGTSIAKSSTQLESPPPPT